MDLVGFDEIDLARTAANIGRFFDLRKVRLRPIVDAVIANDFFMAVDDSIERIDMSMVVDARGSTLARLAFDQTIYRKAKLRVFVNKQIFSFPVGRHPVTP